MQFSSYQTEGFYDEMFQADGAARPHFQLVQEIIQSLSDGQLLRYKHAAERLLLQLGITFNVYGDTAGTERIFPFDLIPRIIPAPEWDRIERGLKQRIHALNAFIDDIYHDQKILKDGAIPAEVVTSAVSYRKQCHGLNPPWGVWCHVTGTDLVRDRDGEYYVLEDNLRVPSGVSYVLENREVLKRIFPGVFEGLAGAPGQRLPKPPAGNAGEPRAPPERLAARGGAHPRHLQLGVLRAQLSGPADGRATGGGPRPGGFRRRRFHAHHPRAWNAWTSSTAAWTTISWTPRRSAPIRMLGVPGLMAAYRAGRVALANAPGNGVADDKVIYAYVPDMIRYYEGEEPILPNVPTYLCWRDADRKYVLENLDKAGGQGGERKRAATACWWGRIPPPPQREEFARRIQAESAQLHRAAHAGALPRAHHRGRSFRGPPRGSAPLRAVRQGYLRASRRAHARRHAQGFAGGQLVAGRRQQGHLGPGGVRHPSLRRSAAIAMPHTKPLLSRVADAVYWLGRYIERAENVARFLDVNHNLMLDLPQDYADQWQPIVDTTGDRAPFLERYGAATKANVVRFLAFDAENPNSIYSCILAGARKCAQRPRNHLVGNVAADQQPLPDDHRRKPQARTARPAHVLPPGPHGLPPDPRHYCTSP